VVLGKEKWLWVENVKMYSIKVKESTRSEIIKSEVSLYQI